MMEMEGRRVRRFGRGRTRSQARSPLPLRITTTNLSNTISCWFCDYKISALNEPLFRFGRRHARSLRVWFSIGTGFSLTALLAVTLILLWELGKALHLFRQKTELENLSTALLFGFSPSSVSGLSISLADAGYLLISTLISVSVHELGHALAAASEGIQMEYIAIFIAVLFPGALVAFNYELLQAFSQFTMLRVYCAGIWHNAVCCAGCGLVLFLLPLILFPFYMHSESPMVLDVSSTSPLFKYLSPGDLIMSLDGVHIHNAEEWMEMTVLIDNVTRQITDHTEYVEGFGAVNGRKGYCVPNFMIEDGQKIQSVDNQSACPNDLTAFVTIPCLDTRMSDSGNSKNGHPKRRQSTHCMNAQDIVKLYKCGDGWTTITNGSSCTCSLDESCLSPLQMPGLSWVEISYLGSFTPECLQLGRNSFSVSKTSDLINSKCVGTFVFVGDVMSMAHSVRLTAYQPRWAFHFGAYLPNVLERILTYTFHVSLTLALLNSLPVYFLDGESLLEVTLCHFTLLSPRKREKVLQVCLLGGTLISILVFMRILFSLFNA
ncbi:membrane-bound transcription factor site-2 protease homolog isoform X1 [Corylus avellana]|uniref:membrane-bound transcription factor site-2 protease homolog isoform X1 n=2 Tax=Corylus avellana TaxID=13451 RepID=UPI00286BFB5A|nr:membrane-bound transcription factor site-2 protease homolog isoform X1 [Corylus avellana]XP_059437143.1 membrane-bound transcription factor site-2 protease homolog isoform X1 [Corylus avellana]XP_059437144.1 membrane-bound transcription factor site-2 protease homolog isoform X1 [Corylus avellana]